MTEMTEDKQLNLRVLDGTKVNDKLINVISGLGTDGDKASHTQDVFIELDYQQLSEMYAANWMSAKVIDMPVDDAMSNPRQISVPSLEEESKLFTEYADQKKIALDKNAKRAIKWSRLYGGSVVVIGVEGAGEPEEELYIERIPKGGLKFLHVVSRHKVSVGQIEQDVMKSNYGEPTSFRINGGGLIHASRIVALRGVELPEDVSSFDDYWGTSILQHCHVPIEQTGVILAQLAAMVFEANIDTVEVSGLTQKLGSDAGKRMVIERFKVGNMMKSTHQLMLLDKELEAYNRNPVDIGKFPELVPSFFSVISGASGIPATRFLGKSPDGMNATGDGDERVYLDSLDDIKEDDIKEIYDRIDPIILMSTYGRIPDDWSYAWPNLWNMDAKDEAEVNSKDATTDKTLIELGVINEYHAADRVQKSGIYPALTEEDVQAMKDVMDIDHTDESQDDTLRPGEEGDEPTNAPEEGEAQEEGNEAPSLGANGEDIQKQALNGAQVASLVDIATKVASGELDRETAIAIVMTSIPGISEEEAGKIVGFEDEDKEPEPVPPMVPGVPPVAAPPVPGPNAPEEDGDQGEGNE